MPVEARIARLFVYPVKGCAGTALAEARLARGAWSTTGAG